MGLRPHSDDLFGATALSVIKRIGFDGIVSRGVAVSLVTLPGVSHFLQEDAPEAVGAMVELFIQLNTRAPQN